MKKLKKPHPHQSEPRTENLLKYSQNIDMAETSAVAERDEYNSLIASIGLVVR